MDQAAAQDAYAALHEKQPYHDGTFTKWAKERSAAFPYHFNHGVQISVDLDDRAPWDQFTTEPNASPVRPQDEAHSPL